jgi:hypothetical protein
MLIVGHQNVDQLQRQKTLVGRELFRKPLIAGDLRFHFVAASTLPMVSYVMVRKSIQQLRESAADINNNNNSCA